jgi:hypothetical protein
MRRRIAPYEARSVIQKKIHIMVEKCWTPFVCSVIVRSMNTHVPNPFTGLKGALAGLMSGGWMGLLLGLLFRRRIAPMLAALESLFAQWKAGTLPVPVAPVRTGAQAPAGRAQAVAPLAPRARRHVPVARRPAVPVGRQQVTRAAAPRVRAAAFHAAGVPFSLTPVLCALRPPRRRIRSRKTRRQDALPHALIVT